MLPRREKLHSIDVGKYFTVSKKSLPASTVVKQKRPNSTSTAMRQKVSRIKLNTLETI